MLTGKCLDGLIEGAWRIMGSSRRERSVRALEGALLEMPLSAHGR